MNDENHRRARKLSDWRHEWTLRHLDRADFRPHGRPATSDYNLHHLEENPPGDAEAEFVLRQREILGLDHRTGAPLPTPGHDARFLGAVLAGAAGDALGHHVGTVGAAAIRREHGERWFAEPSFPDGRAPVSATAELMLFTAEALIGPHIVNRLDRTGPAPVITSPVDHVSYSYRRWAARRGHDPEQLFGPLPPAVREVGWLVGEPAAAGAGAAGDAVAAVLLGQSRDGCRGGDCVARAVPLALWPATEDELFRIAADTARLTHRRPDDHLAAGAFAVLLRQVLSGARLADAVAAARAVAASRPDSATTVRFLDVAVELAGTAPSPRLLAEAFGPARTGAQALGLAVYATLVSDYVREALAVAVGHDGDTATTGLLCGALAGACWGIAAVPADLLAPLVPRAVIEVLARDALAEFGPRPPDDPLWTARYWTD